MDVFVMDGFFSVGFNKHCRNDELMIRARDYRDIKELSKHMTLGPILPTPDNDFPYRAIAKRSNWAGYLVATATFLSYNRLDHFVAAFNREDNPGYPPERHKAITASSAAVKNVYEGI